MLHRREKHPSARFRQFGEAVVLWLQCVTTCVFVSLFSIYVFLYFSANFLLGHFQTMTECNKVCVFCLLGELPGACETGPCPLQRLDAGLNIPLLMTFRCESKAMFAEHIYEGADALACQEHVCART